MVPVRAPESCSQLLDGGPVGGIPLPEFTGPGDVGLKEDKLEELFFFKGLADYYDQLSNFPLVVEGRSHVSSRVLHVIGGVELKCSNAVLDG
jgi:hypothetical protein